MRNRCELCGDKKRAPVMEALIALLGFVLAVA